MALQNVSPIFVRVKSKRIDGPSIDACRNRGVLDGSLEGESGPLSPKIGPLLLDS